MPTTHPGLVVPLPMVTLGAEFVRLPVDDPLVVVALGKSLLGTSGLVSLAGGDEEQIGRIFKASL